METEVSSYILSQYVEHKRSIRSLMKELHKGEKSIRSALVSEGIELHRGPKHVFQSGDRVGNRTIIEVVKRTGRGSVRFVVKCDCGEVSKTNTSNLTRNRGCKKCWHISHSGENHTRWTGYGDITGAYWGSITSGANIRGIEMHVSIEEAWELYQKQNGICALSGLPISFKPEQVASFDRIDSNISYTLDNVQWVHKHINKMKMEYSVPYFLEMCQRVCRFNEANGHG